MIENIKSDYGKYNFISKKDLIKINAREVVQNEFGVETFSKNVWKKIDMMLDFGSTKDTLLNGLSEKENEQFLKILSALLKKGIIGWEYYEVNGQIEKHFVDVSIGDQRLANAEPTKWTKPEGYY